MSTVITSIDRRSPADRYGIKVGEKLLTINGHEIIDVLDYRFYGYDAESVITLSSPDGKGREVRIRKEEGQDLGLNFDTYLMDEMRPCSNHCIFCFVDQMPPGMRKTLYVKDDDWRMSLMMGFTGSSETIETNMVEKPKTQYQTPQHTKISTFLSYSFEITKIPLIFISHSDIMVTDI
mgnify:CR=1 FL=1